MSRARRRMGRAVRRARRAAAGQPPLISALTVRFEVLSEALRTIGVSGENLAALLASLRWTASPRPTRPLIHNGRKYRR